MRSETKSTFGFRDKESGKLLRLSIRSNDGQDFCGEETVYLDVGIPSFPRYETENIVDIIKTLEEDPAWYNSSRERPSWGSFQPNQLIPVIYSKTMKFDAFGEEPISVDEKIMAVDLPHRFQGKLYNTRSKTPPAILKRVFGEAYEAVAASENDEIPIFAVVQIIDLRDENAAIGDLVTTGSGSTGQLDALRKIPETWPQDIHDKLDLTDTGLMLALVRTSRFDGYRLAREFTPQDFEIHENSPSP